MNPPKHPANPPKSTAQLPPQNLISDAQLSRSAIVANNRMNRERVLWGINSYQKELGIDLMAFLEQRAATEQQVRWMDLCCGNANALIQGHEVLRAQENGHRYHLEGLDLVGIFPDMTPTAERQLQLHAGTVADWQPNESYDLVTCVHGIHYLGDKLGLIQKVLLHLKEDGIFVFNFDVHNFRDAEGAPMRAWWKLQCQQKGWIYQPKRRMLTITGHQHWPQTWEYLGASDEAGPNYSGQDAVNSFYKI